MRRHSPRAPRSQGKEGWVAHDQLKRAALKRERLLAPQVSLDDPYPLGDSIEESVATRERRQGGLDLHPDEGSVGIPGRKDQGDDAAATTEIEHLSQAGPQGKVGQDERVLGDPCTPPRLQKLEAPA